MAANDFASFLDQVGKDPALQAELNQTASAEDFAATAVSLATRLGMHFSTSDVHKAMATEAAQLTESEELSDEQLDAVAGGDGTCGGVSCIVTSQRGAQTLACNYNLKLNWKVHY